MTCDGGTCYQGCAHTESAWAEKLAAAEERARRLATVIEDGMTHLLKMKDGAHNCPRCGMLYEEWKAALAPPPEAEKKGGG